MRVRTFTCGRGMHRVFFIEKGFVVKTGWIMYSKGGMVMHRESKEVPFLLRLFSTKEYYSTLWDDWFSETTSRTGNETEGL